MKSPCSRLGRIIILLLAHAFVAGCGGGGSSSTSSQTTPHPPILSITSANAPVIAEAAFVTAENLLMLADEAAFALQKVDGTALYQHPYNCLLGSSSYSHSDSDGDGRLSAMDRITVTYNGCKTPTSNGWLQGMLSITLISVDDQRGTDDVLYVASIAPNELELSRDSGDWIRVIGEYEFEYIRGIYQSSLIARSKSPGFAPVNDSWRATYQNFEIEKHEYYEPAEYSVSMTGKLDVLRIAGEVVVSTPELLVAPLNTFPTAGRVEILGSDGSRMLVTPDALSPEQYSILVDEDGDGEFTDINQDMPWNTITQGFLWWYEMGFPHQYRIKTYDLNDFEILNFRPFSLGNFGSEIIGVNSPLRIQGSRPIDPASLPPGLQIKQINDEWPYVGFFVDLDIEFRGAMILLRPTRQLSPGGAYMLDTSGFWLSDINGNQDSIGFGALNAAVAEPLVSVSDPIEAFGFPGESLQVSGLDSTSVDGSDLTFEWTQVLGPTTQIANTESNTATVTLPMVSKPELVRLYLRTTNEFGEYDYAKTDLSVFSSPGDIDIAVMRGRKFDGSKHELLYTAANGEQTHSFNGAWNVTTKNRTYYVVPTSPSSYLPFRLDLDLSFSVPDDQTFAVGSYTNITETSLGDVSARMSIRSTMKCINFIGEFHVLEFELDQIDNIDKLAIDYEAQCGANEEYEHVSGHIRKRSLIPIPPAPP